MHRLRLALLVLAACAAAGCGATEGSELRDASDEDQIRSLVKAYNHAFARGEVAAACDLMTEEARALAAGAATGCEAEFERARGLIDAAGLRKLANVEILSVERRGFGAEVETSDGLTTPVTKRGDEWRVSGLSWLICDPARNDRRCES
jgi:hypothetical protein